MSTTTSNSSTFTDEFVAPPFDRTYALVPQYLRDAFHWVLWKHEQDKDGRWCKPPYNPNTDMLADKTNLRHQGSFAQALQKFLNPGRVKYAYAGLGYCLMEEDDVVTLDLDECVDEAGHIAPWAVEHIKRFLSYWEASPGDGLHCTFLVHEKPPDNYRSAIVNGHKIELLISKCYFTVTGRHIAGTPSEIADCSEAFTWLYEQLPPQAKRQEQREQRERGLDALPDLENGKLLDLAMASKAIAKGIYPCSCGASEHTLGELLTDRYSGSNRHDGNNTSCADYNLLESLAYWTRKDADWMDAIFRKSPRMREKWDTVHYASGATYGEGNIDAAIANCKRTRQASGEEGVQVGTPPGASGRTDEQDQEQQPQRQSRYAKVTLHDLFARPKPRYLLDDYLYEHESSMLLGESDVGKSFLVLDWCICIALGIPWHGHKTVRKKVIYVAGEGASNYPRRIDACLKKYERTLDELEENFSFVEVAVPLLEKDGSGVSEFITQKRAELEEESGDELGLLVFDTLSRCTAGKNESDNGLMALAVQECERARDELSAWHVLIIHHNSDKPNAAKTGRGASSLKGTVNVMMTLEKCNEIVTLSLIRSKDHDEHTQDHMRRVVVPTSLWDEQKNEHFTSCIMEPIEGIVLTPSVKKLTPLQQRVLDALPLAGATFTEWRKLAGMEEKASTFKKVRNLPVDELEIVTPIAGVYTRSSDSLK